jgi:hypothetical protein
MYVGEDGASDWEWREMVPPSRRTNGSITVFATCFNKSQLASATISYHQIRCIEERRKLMEIGDVFHQHHGIWATGCVS